MFPQNLLSGLRIFRSRPVLVPVEIKFDFTRRGEPLVKGCVAAHLIESTEAKKRRINTLAGKKQDEWVRILLRGYFQLNRRKIKDYIDKNGQQGYRDIIWGYLSPRLPLIGLELDNVIISE